VGILYVVQAGLELKTLLLQPPECWRYRHVPGFKTFLEYIADRRDSAFYFWVRVEESKLRCFSHWHHITQLIFRVGGQMF
jgi:hypothetical protein